MMAKHEPECAKSNCDERRTKKTALSWHNQRFRSRESGFQPAPIISQWRADESIATYISVTPPQQQILGIPFFLGTADAVISQISKSGGFVVAPSAPGMVRLSDDAPYRRAMLAADVAIPDSGLMVLVWRLLRRQTIRRLSGLRYLNELLPALRREDTIFWVLPSAPSREKLLAWARGEAFPVKIDNCYVAPRYGPEIEDRHLLGLIAERRPAHVLVAIGSGPQEKLAHYLIQRLDYRPAIHCIGAALGFITGDQTPIPDWADRFYLGWLVRFLAQPRLFAPRVLMALKLPALMIKCGENLPPLRSR
jgi:N-acetylglucosaminyldiphosphoundecaprenol N-acetyl-beta-D-mannosaminyltransferase